MDNRSGLIVDARLTRVSGHAERLVALEMVQHIAERPGAITLGADRGYDAADFVEELRTLNVRPHVAQNTSGRRSTSAQRGIRAMARASRCANALRKHSPGSRLSPVCARPSSEALQKWTGPSPFAAAAYNLVRLPKLVGAA